MSTKKAIDEDDVDEFLYGTSSNKDSIGENVDKSSSTDTKDAEGDDDELYNLYKGSTANETEELSGKQASAAKRTGGEGQETGDNENQEDNADEDEDEDEDESDDDLEIILEHESTTGERSTQSGQDEAKAAAAPINLKPGEQNKQGSTQQSSQNATVKTGGIDLEAIGEYNGIPITDTDLDSFEDKPWRKPGSDITDYFNYGFNEITWRTYSAKQKILRDSKKMMGDIDPSTMPMNMMMPPGMPGMPNMMPMSMPPMGMPMNMPPQGPGMRGRGGPSMGRSKHSGKDRDDGAPDDDDGSGMFPMDFKGMPMNMFPPDMAGGPMGMPFFGANMGFDGSGGGPPRGPMRGSGPSRAGGRSTNSPSAGGGPRYPSSSNTGSYDDGHDHRDSRKRHHGNSSHDDYHKRSRNR